MAKAEGSHFGHITALPAEMPPGDGGSIVNSSTGKTQREMAGRAISRCGTPTFGSRTSLPSLEETITKFGGKASKSRLPALSSRWASKTNSAIYPKTENSSAPKKRPSPLSVPPLSILPPSSPANKNFCSPKPRTVPSMHARQPLQTSTRPQDDIPSAKQDIDISALKSPRCPVRRESPSPRQPALSKCTSHAQLVPKAVLSPSHPVITRRASHAQLYKPCLSPAPPLPSSIPVRIAQEPASPVSSRSPATVSGLKTPTTRSPSVGRRSSCANLTQSFRARACSVLAPPLPIGAGRGAGIGLLNGSRGTRLKFEKEGEVFDQSYAKVTVLQAAAKIEHGLLLERSP